MSKRILSVGSEHSFVEQRPDSKKMAHAGEVLKFEDIENGEALSECLTALENGVSGLAADTTDIKCNIIRFLTSVVIRQQRDIDKLKTDVTDLKCRSMRDNILVHEIQEKEGEKPEQCEDAIKDFLEKIPGITRDDLLFERVHRLGQKKEGQKKPRPIVAKLTYYKTKALIMENKPDRPKRSNKTCEHNYTFLIAL